MSNPADDLNTRRSELALQLANEHYARNPDLKTRYGPAGFEHCVADGAFHLQYLEQALRADNEALFADYARWAKVMLETRRIPTADLVSNLRLLADVVAEAIPDLAARARKTVTFAIDSLEAVDMTSTGAPHEALADAYLRAVIDGDRRVAGKLIHDAVDSGVSLRDIYLHVFQPVQYEIGAMWQRNQIGVADEHLATAITQMIMSQLYPLLFTGARKQRTIVTACVGGELHEIGARMVADFFEMAGWNTFYLGANTPVAGIVQTACERRADILGISVTISYHVKTAEDAIRQVREDGRCASTKIIVGGYPFRVAPELWKTIGADGYAADAGEAIALAEKLTYGKLN